MFREFMQFRSKEPEGPSSLSHVAVLRRPSAAADALGTNGPAAAEALYPFFGILLRPLLASVAMRQRLRQRYRHCVSPANSDFKRAFFSTLELYHKVLREQRVALCEECRGDNHRVID